MRLSKLGEVVESNRERLNRIFTYYCSFGEPLNTSKMRSSKFIKLLKDAKLLEAPKISQGAQTPSNFRGNAGTRNIFGVDEPPHPQPLRRPRENPGAQSTKNLGQSGPCISKVDADLLFTRHTGMAKSKKLPPSAASKGQSPAISSSFSQ